MAKARTLRILVVDDHPVVREGIRVCLKDWTDLKIVGEARDGNDGIREVRAKRPDVVLLDLTMPNMGGLEALAGIRRAHPKTRVIIFTVHSTREYVRRALASRVDGYLLKDTAPSEYVEAVRTVMRGEVFISPAVARHARVEASVKTAARFGLTEAEFQYLTLAARGERPAEIALTMNCSTVAVRSYRRHVFRRLKFRDMAMLTRFALENGL
jgi:DNA-binding NarL/FixJ family response regulator